MSSDRVLTPLPAPARPTAPAGPPRRRSGVRAAALGAASVLVLAACGSGGGDDAAAAESDPALDAITVEEGFGEQPTIEFEAPFELEESASETLTVGDGEEVVEGDTVTIDYSIASGTDGSELETSFGASTISLALAEGQTTPDLVEALVGQTLGSRVLVAVAPPAPPEGDDASAAPVDPNAQTIIFVIDLLEVLPDRAEGEPVDQPEGTPVVETDDEGDVTGIDVEGVEAPEELVVTPVLQGDGTEVQADDTVTIHYTGVLASDGSQFDSSWERGAPTTFPLTQLIAGWQEGLTGVPVGSRVVLQVPSELAYGDRADNEAIPPNSDLVFVIDVLATAPAPEAPEAPAAPEGEPSAEPSPEASE